MLAPILPRPIIPRCTELFLSNREQAVEPTLRACCDHEALGKTELMSGPTC